MDQINFLRGVPADETLEVLKPKIMQGYRKTLETWSVDILQYTSAQADFNGFRPLRRTLAIRYGLDASDWPRVICSNGGMETLSFLFKFLSPGSCIAAEVLTYDRVLQDAQKQQLHVFGVNQTFTGIDLEDLEKTLSNKNIQLFYHIPFHQNPTGLTASIENINDVATICRQHGVLYVCDIAYDELWYGGGPNPCIDLSLPCHGKTCLVGSFTKTISPGTKCGFGIFPPHLVERLTPVIANTRLNPNYPTQAMIDWLINEGHFATHLSYLRDFYRPKKVAMIRALSDHFPGAIIPPINGGFFTLLTLNKLSHPEKFVEIARGRGVSIEIANVCTPDCQQKYQAHYLPVRLTFPALTEQQIETGIGIIAQAYRDAN